MKIVNVDSTLYLSDVYMSQPVPPSITLTKKFGVSINVMEAMLNHLGVSHFNSAKSPAKQLDLPSISIYSLICKNVCDAPSERNGRCI